MNILISIIVFFVVFGLFLFFALFPLVLAGFVLWYAYSRRVSILKAFDKVFTMAIDFVRRKWYNSNHENS